MAGQPPIDDEDEKPLDPAVERVRRKMVRFFAINIGILMIALMAVLVAVVYKASRSTGGGDTLASGEIRLAPGETLISQAVGDGLLSLLVEGAGGSRSVIVVDTHSGKTVARHRIVTGE